MLLVIVTCLGGGVCLGIFPSSSLKIVADDCLPVPCLLHIVFLLPSIMIVLAVNCLDIFSAIFSGQIRTFFMGGLTDTPVGSCGLLSKEKQIRLLVIHENMTQTL